MNSRSAQCRVIELVSSASHLFARDFQIDFRKMADQRPCDKPTGIIESLSWLFSAMHIFGTKFMNHGCLLPES
jgi:hypothetical protein